MKVMFVVYHDLKNEARSQEILECAKLLGDTTLVSYSQPIKSKNYKYIETGKGKRKYLQFIISAIKAIITEKPDIIILHDNYTALLIPVIKRYLKKTKIIYDSSELYIEKNDFKSIKWIVAEQFRLLEKKYLRSADVVIAANIERATIMKQYYKLSKTPLIFDNIHKIDEEYNLEECEKKYSHIFNNDTVNILYAGGIGKKRLTFELAKAVGNLGENYSLNVIGSTTDKDKKLFIDFLDKEKINNVKYIGFVPRNELRFLLKKSFISVSIFSQDSINNINCASGKLYESLFEITPVLTSENPPFKRICNDFGIGVSTSDFERGIKDLEKNYAFYRKNISNYISSINFNDRISSLTKNILHSL